MSKDGLTDFCTRTGLAAAEDPELSSASPERVAGAVVVSADALAHGRNIIVRPEDIDTIADFYEAVARELRRIAAERRAPGSRSAS
jgi:hypothetical protein